MIQHDISFDAKDTEKNMDRLFSMLDEAKWHLRQIK